MVINDNQVVAIHPSTTMDSKPQFVVYHEFILTSKNFIRIVMTFCLIKKQVSNIRGEWLFQLAANHFKPEDVKNIETRRELQNIERDLVQSLKNKKGQIKN